MTESPKPELAIFTEALTLPLDARIAFLDRACAGNEPLRHRVDRLLKVYSRAGGFLEQSPAGPVAIEVRAAKVGEKPGDQIGRYKLLEQIGEGGCGVVFMAEQTEPVRRQVALKILKPGMDTKSVIARFEAERQVLALMDHPNIAKVFDAGATESGRPYFVMELIRGVKITEYCDRHVLTTGDRLRLFVQICHAIQHAHQKGIIHRDIKPSNILVTTTPDEAALPVVIDFGIAKAATSQRLTDKTLLTSFDLLVGTPAYMSPEQVALTGVDVDTRADIYSLGVLLYELLTGAPPFDTRELLKSGLDEIRRVVREQDPLPPSTKLRRMTGADLAAVALHRGIEPPRLIRATSGDLDWIVMKAMEKDRARRYQTANGLALDIQRYLTDEAVSARPPSTLYKFQKTVQRNKLVFAGAAVITALLVTSLVVVSATLARERQARLKADTEAAKSRQVTDFLEEMLKGVGPSVALGRDTTMLREILDKTAGRIGGELTNQPAVEAELRSLLGQLYVDIGNYDQAEVMQRAALSLNVSLYGPETPEVATAMNNLGETFLKAGRHSVAEPLFAEALNIRRRVLGHDHADVATSLSDMALAYTLEGRDIEAEALTREALAIQQKLFGTDSLESADSLRTLGIILGDEGRTDEAEARMRQMLEIRRQRLGPDDPLVATALTDVAWVVGMGSKASVAELLEKEALAVRLKVLPPNHPELAKSIYLIGDRERALGNLADSGDILQAALSIQKQILGPDNPELLDTMRSLGTTYQAEGRLAESESVHREALEIWRQRGEMGTPRGVAELQCLVDVLAAEKKTDEAEKLLDDTLTPAMTSQASCASLLYARASLRARHARWQAAANDVVLALKYHPFDHNMYCPAAALLVKAGNRPAYEDLCRSLIARCGDTTNIYVADAVAKAGLFLASSNIDLKVLNRLAGLTVTNGAEDASALPFFEICKALAEYRQGHYAAAADWALRSAGSDRTEAQPHAAAVLALADWQLGKQADARDLVARIEARVPRIMPAEVVEDAGTPWVAWLYARVQLDEAEALIRPQ